MVAASVLVAATAVAQMRPMEKFIRVGIGAGPSSTTVCGLTDTNLLRCWGSASYEYPQVLDQLETQSGAYTFRSFWMGPSGVCSVMDNVADGTSRTGCSAVMYSGTASAATWAEFGQTSVLRVYVGGVGLAGARGRKIAIGPINTCAIYGASATPGSAGQVACAGENWAGVSLGIPNVGNTSVFGSGVVAGLINIVDISVSTDDNFMLNDNGGGFTCAVEGPGADQGKVKCWGYNLSGQLGNGQTAVPPTTYGASSPVVATGISTATAVSAGSQHTCAVLADNTASCWGANPDGRLGNNNGAVVNVPTVVAGLSGVTSVVAGYTHSCAIGTSGNVFCWGNNAGGLLGNTSFTGAFSSTPQQVTGVTGANTLAISQTGTCATLTNGSIRCWPAATDFPAIAVPGDCNMDFDGNGSVSATTDGLMGLRALLGLSGSAVTNGALGAGARWSWPEIRTVMTRNCGIPGISQ